VNAGLSGVHVTRQIGRWVQEGLDCQSLLKTSVPSVSSCWLLDSSGKERIVNVLTDLLLWCGFRRGFSGGKRRWHRNQKVGVRKILGL